MGFKVKKKRENREDLRDFFLFTGIFKMRNLWDTQTSVARAVNPKNINEADVRLAVQRRNAGAFSVFFAYFALGWAFL